MRCRRIRDLIAIEQDGILTATELDTLTQHVGQCDACSTYRAQVLGVTTLFAEDAHRLRANASLAPEFTSRLRQTLYAEQSSAASRPAAAFDRLADALTAQQGTLRGLVSRALAAAACAVLLFLVARAVLVQPTQSTSECTFGHLASYEARTAPDGRVYASLDGHNSAGRSCLREGYRP